MKRVLLSLILLVVSLATFAHDFEVNGIYYNKLSASTCEVTHKGNDYFSPEYRGAVVIPARVNNLDVTRIGEGAFVNCGFLTSLTIPSSVTRIGDRAFDYCKSLTSLTIPSSVTSIGYSAFDGCSSLASITIPNSVTSIGYSAFVGCSSLASITIPNSVTSIEHNTFENCSSLASFTIPNSVTSIGESAFAGCSGLTSITIPNSVTRIGSKAFGGCTSLTSVSIGQGVTSIGAEAFYRCSSLTSITVAETNLSFISIDGILYNKDVTEIKYCPEGKNGTVTIPNSVTSIGEGAFYNCDGLTSITIPNSVTSIGNYAFYNCDGLTSITIPNSVTSIGSKAFRDCSSLTSITIPNSVTSIGDRAFEDCSSLTSITLPNSLTSLGTYTFEDCTGLTNVTIDIAYISEGSFSGCSGLTSITFGNGVKTIGYGVFSDCTGLTSIIIPNNITSIGNRAFEDCSSLTSVTIPNSVTYIGEDAFSGCTNLPVEDGIRYADCVAIGVIDKNRDNYVVRAGTRFIHSNAFAYCTNLTSVTIPSSVADVGAYAFRESKVGTITVKAMQPPVCRRRAFINMPTTPTLKVYASAKSAYENADQWKDLIISTMSDPDAIQSITLNSTSKTMEVGDTYQLNATILPLSALDNIVSWVSNNQDVATVNSQGLVTAVAVGTAEITCKANGGDGVSAVCKITVKGKNAEVKLSPVGYATFYNSTSAYKLPSGLYAKVVTDCDDNKLTYKTIAGGSSSNVIPKGTAVVLVSGSKKEGTYTLTSVENTDLYTGANLLHGSDEATTTTASGENYYYKLTYGEGAESDIFGWYWGAEDGAAFQIDGHKAWLALPKSSVTRSGFALDDETSIEEVMTEEDAVYYDLQGRRIGTPTVSGIYIVNGKKVIIKK